MDGYRLYLISGIDGSFYDYDKGVGELITGVNVRKLAYNRQLTFVQNIAHMREVISRDMQPCTLLGWSIGAVAACFLSDIANVHAAIVINAFYKRSEVLAARNIFCDEEVCVGDTKRQNVRYAIIRGAKDNKIPPHESERIRQHYTLQEDCLFTFTEACHSIRSFPTEELSSIITKYL